MLAAVTTLLSLVSCSSIRVASWNVYYKALDDPFGSSAITTAIDAADRDSAFDFVGLVEAGGDTPAGVVEQWTQNSATLKQGNGMEMVSGVSGYETIALFYRKSNWKVAGYIHTGEFEPGRPFLITQFTHASAEAGNSAPSSLWVVLVHLNHYFISYPSKLDPTVPGSVLADALHNASVATGVNISDPSSGASVIIMGDFNEYEWADFAQPYKAGL